MEILFVTSEAVPWVKTGGLGDVCGSLPKALLNLGNKVTVILPLYRQIKQKVTSLNYIGELNVPFGREEKKGLLYSIPSTDKKELKYLFIEDKEKKYFDRDYLYSTPQGEYLDNGERFYFFSRAVYEALRQELLDSPNIVHCHDWQTALVPLFIRLLPFLSKKKKLIKTIFTIHNLGYQGIFPYSILEIFSGLDINYLFSWERLEFWGKVNFMKAGIIYSNAITTVSSGYCEEIKQRQFGFGLENLLSFFSSKLFGILNGIDYDEFSPQIDKFIPFNYSRNNLANKERNKEALLKEAGLNYSKKDALLCMISRLTVQKGIDLVIKMIPSLLQYPVKLLILGTGEEKYHFLLEELQRRYRSKLKVYIGFDEILAHKLYAAADMILIPSLYEPCGLVQFIALRYATIPIGHKVGGLKDTISEFDPLLGKGEGFLFSPYEKEAFLDAIKKALYIYRHKSDWQKVQYNALKKDFSWHNSAKKYNLLYKKVSSLSWEH